MALSIAAVDICNMALDMLKEAPITSLDDDHPVAERLKRNFDIMRDSFLSSHPWNFAMKRAALAADATAPAYGWDYRYLIPGDCVQLRPLRKEGEFEGALVPHEVEGGYILTDEVAPLEVSYTKQATEYGQWHPAAIAAFAAYIAMNIAHSVTGKASYSEMMAARYRESMMEAKRLDGMTGWAERPDYNDVIAVRY